VALLLAEAIISAAPTDLASAIHRSLHRVVPHRAVALFSPACPTAPVVRCADAHMEEQLAGVPWWAPEHVPGGMRVERFSDAKPDGEPTVLVLLVRSGQRLPDWQRGLVQGAVRLLAARAAQFVRAPVAAELTLASVATAERERIRSLLEHQHSDALRTVLATLRGREVAPDVRVRRAIEVASDALRELHETADAERRDGSVRVGERFEALEVELAELLVSTGVSGEFGLEGDRAVEVSIAAAIAAQATCRTLVLDVLEEAHAGRLRVCWRLRDARLEVEVVDNGAGQTDRVQAAGVTRARELADALGGETLVSAVPGWGTRITVGLPAAPRQASRTQSPELEAIGRLSDRERDVVVLLAAGLSNREIGERLHLSPHTVKRHISHVFQKLEVGSRAEAARMAQGSGLLAADA
jgi:DNA-binding NarL/FixJ family response regulator